MVPGVFDEFSGSQADRFDRDPLNNPENLCEFAPEGNYRTSRLAGAVLLDKTGQAEVGDANLLSRAEHHVAILSSSRAAS